MMKNICFHYPYCGALGQVENVGAGTFTPTRFNYGFTPEVGPVCYKPSSFTLNDSSYNWHPEPTVPITVKY